MAELFKVNAPVRKPLFEGVQGENEARSIQFDITPWVEELGDGAVTATAKRSQDSQPYPVTVTKDGNVVTWKPTSTDTAFAGVGSFQLEYTVDSVLAKTCIWSTMVAPSLDPAGDPPDPYDNWLAEMREIAADAIQAAQDAEASAESIASAEDDLEVALDSLSGEEEQATAGSTQYYKIVSALEVGKAYLIGITVQTAGTYTVKIGTEESAGTMVATLFDNVAFSANVTQYCVYRPTTINNRCIRLSTNTVPWSATVAEIYDVNEINETIQDTKIVVDNELTDAVYTDRTPVELTIQNDGFYDTAGRFIDSDTTRAYAIVNVSSGETYLLNTFIRSGILPAVLFFSDNTFMYYEKKGTGVDETLTDYLVTVPTSCNKLIVQSADGTNPPTLEAVTIERVSKAYTKSEADARFMAKGAAESSYGVRWSLTDPDDLGERCFGAVGLNATIGIGATDGVSDFDSIYPWSDIKRCNIKTNANGAFVVTYEGEAGFALDGSNGDVFVRIPKFNILRYKEDGYEYRVIGAANAPTHEAFIENGKELDEIFVSAFEGFVGSDEKLHSKAGVIPTSNITPDEFLESAQAMGAKYSLYDNRCVDAIWSLFAVEYGTRNTNSVLGFGLANFMQPTDHSFLRIAEAETSTNSVKVPLMDSGYKELMPVNSNITICQGTQNNVIAQRKITSITDSGNYTIFAFDGAPINVDTTCFIGSAALKTNFCETTPTGQLSWHTGKANWSQNYPTAQNPIRYRWIENPIGNLWHFLPDVTFVNGQMYVCNDMSEYEFFKHDGVAYEPVGDPFPENDDNGNKANVRNANYWITSLADETFAKPVLFGRSYDKSLLAQQSFGAYYYLYNADIVTIANGGGFDHLYRCNMLTQRAWIKGGDKWYLYGARLMFKNI